MHDSFTEDEMRLRDVLTSLGAATEEITDEGFRISDDGGAPGLTALLLEIEETVLPRLLTFTGGAGAQLTVTVAERRVLRIGSQDGEMKSAETAEQVAALLNTFCAGAAAVHVRRDLLGQAPTATAAGVSLTDLSPFLAGKAEPVVPVEVALAESESYVLALCDARDEGRLQIKGQDAICVRLQQLEEGLPREADDSESAAPACRIWTGGPSDPFAVLLTTLPQGRIWLAFEPEHLDACIACWSKTV